MTARNLQNLNTDLEDTGFVQTEGDRFRWDSLRGKNAKRQELPWDILSWELEARGHDLYQESFAARLNADHFLQNCEDLFRERFPTFRKVALQEDKKGGYWILVEFLDRDLDADQSRIIESDVKADAALPHGLCALHLSVIQSSGQLSLFMTKHCFIGNTPGAFFIELPKLLNSALFGTALANKTNFNAYLLTLRSETLRASLIEFCALPEFVHNLLQDKGTAEKGFGQVRLSFVGKNWQLAWSHGEEVPELLVPPMEILEQKEVARRFQRLDELILLEDYAGALLQCQDYLEKNPQSLYLIRRLAFLSLWAGQDFAHKHLDLMIKFDPTNLMTLSLWVRQGLKTANPDVLLESLSKLGSALGHSIVDFDSLDITSLTLPEMLGDAWNQKDDQRAVSCYERVLRSRGEIPRILVKLIRLMRDIEDPAAEEAYMDRLLSCEVPTRTRAAIYYRLAEIKQRVDPADACQWALKSWHTNRAHVRYAILAADLLIQLDRSHDAAHVLVETSELIDDSGVEQRLQLEVKIAGIWLEHMQRVDLASERIMRALELIKDELEVFDEIIRLVKKIDDHPLLLDVSKKALFLANSLGDQARADQYVQVLLELGESDSPIASEIFTIVLKNALVGINLTQSLFQRDDLDLPLSSIISTMEDRLAHLEGPEQGAYYQLLGDVSQDRAEDPERILSFYERALAAQSMSSRSFDFLDTYYSRMGMNSQRFLLLQRKLSQAQGSERAVLLRELYYFDEGVSDKDKDSYAIQILASDADDVGPIEERLAVYEQNHDGEAILSLTHALRSHGIDLEVTSGFIRSALASINGMQGSNRHLWLIQLLGKLREAGEDTLDLARLTVQYLWDAEEKTWVREPLVTLIGRGEIPDLPAGEMLAVIDDDSLKVELLLHLAERGKDFEEILAYEREALRLAKDLPDMISIKLEIQIRIANKSELTVSELDLFLKECKNLGRQGDTIPYLTSQLRHSTHGDHKQFVLKQIESALLSHATIDTIPQALMQAIIEMPLSDSSALRLVWLDHFGFHRELHSLAHFEQILIEMGLGKKTIAILPLLDQLLEVAAANKPAIMVMINRFLGRLLADKRDDELKVYAQNPSIISLLDSRTTRALTEYYLKKKDIESFQAFWWQSLIRLEGVQETIEFLHYSRKSYGSLELTREFFTRLEQIIENDSGSVEAAVLFELKLYLADYLIEVNTSSRRAGTMLENLYAERPSEPRVWGGLIALYRETDAEADLYELLYKVLPALKEDPRPLKEYQLSVSGLELEFNELSAKLALQKDSVLNELPQPSVIQASTPTAPMKTFSFDHAKMFASEPQSESTQVSGLPPAPPLASPSSSNGAPVFELGDMSLTFERELMKAESDSDEPKSKGDLHEGHSLAHDLGLSLVDNFEGSDEFAMVSSKDSKFAQNRTADTFVPPAFSFSDESLHYATDHGQKPASLPSHTHTHTHTQTQIGSLDDLDLDSPFRLDSTSTSAGSPSASAFASDSVSLYEKTNAYSPMADFSLPPPVPTIPPPPAHSIRFDDDDAPVEGDGDLVFEESDQHANPASNGEEESDSALAFASENLGSTPAAAFDLEFDVTQFAVSEPSKAVPAKRSDLSLSWRTVARSHLADNGLTQDLLQNPFADIPEQVMAVQVAALMEDKIPSLNAFPYRVWRDPQSLQFELKWADRMSREMFHPGIKSPLAKLLKALYPLFIQAFSNEMGLLGVADRLKMRPDEIMKIRKPIEFSDEVIQRTNLRYYVSSLQDNGYHIYHLPSIGDRFQFDFAKRDIYVDRNHYMAAPPTHIFHRLAFLLRAVSLDYFPFLHLSPGGEIFPFLMKCKRSLDQTDGVKRVLGMDKDPLRAILAQSKDRDYLVQLFSELGNLSADRISQTISFFIEQIYRLNLAETLDLIGVIETISGVDLCNPRASSSQRINQSTSAKSILAFAAELKLSQKP